MEEECNKADSPLRLPVDAPRQPQRLVMVSNRVADPRRDHRQGGLSVAIAETLAPSGALWFGWSGGSRNDAATAQPKVQHSQGIDLVTIDLTESELDGYYYGFANQCLWPILHYRPDLVRFERRFLQQYLSVNRRFAEALLPLLRAGDAVWIHDFHLLPLGLELRRLGAGQRIGFFLHVPFPPPEVVAALPSHRELFEKVLACDLIGLQTASDLACFRAYVGRELGAVLGPGNCLHVDGRRVGLCPVPVGIDAGAFARLCETKETRAQIESIRRSLGGRALIVGVDRLDYTKGLPQRLMAYRRLLETRPEYRSRIVFTQIAPPTREALDPYAQIRREVDRLESLIHGDFAEFDWTPMHYIRRHVGRNRLAGLYRAARVGLVTPLRDGMNLVAKEFVVAQDAGDPGVLVLSRFAGAAEALTAALIVNPYDVDQVADALERALRMPLDERRARHAALLAEIRTHDVHAWREAFLGALTEPDRPAHRLPSRADRKRPAWPPPAPGRSDRPRRLVHDRDVAHPR